MCLFNTADITAILLGQNQGSNLHITFDINCMQSHEGIGTTNCDFIYIFVNLNKSYFRLKY